MTTSHGATDIDGGVPRQRTRETPPDPAVPVPPLPSPRPSARDVAAIKASLAAVRQRPVALAESFYDHLFEIAPAARPMFAADLTAQMQRMTDVLLTTLAALEGDDPGGALERSLHALGVLHRDRWGVQPQHYLYIAHALTRAVREVSGPAWSGSLSSSWIALTQWITGHMLAGHHDAAARDVSQETPEVAGK